VSNSVTLQAIADKLGYSKNKMSLALHNSPQIPQGTKERIQRAASKLGYRPNAIVARSMAELRSRQKSKFQAKVDPRIFKSWILESKPDVVLTLYNSVSGWIQEVGLLVPDNIVFAQLGRRPESPRFSGMDQHSDIAG